MKVCIIFVLLSFNFLGPNALAQEKFVQLNISDIRLDENNFLLNIQLVNNSKSLLRIYKPETDDICNSILKIKIISRDNDEKVYFMNPCKEIVDLDTIIIGDKNSVFLSPGEYFGKIFTFSYKDISPYLKKGSYKIQVQLNYSIAEFEGDVDDLFIDNLVSIYHNFQL